MRKNAVLVASCRKEGEEVGKLGLYPRPQARLKVQNAKVSTTTTSALDALLINRLVSRISYMHVLTISFLWLHCSVPQSKTYVIALFGGEH